MRPRNESEKENKRKIDEGETNKYFKKSLHKIVSEHDTYKIEINELTVARRINLLWKFRDSYFKSSLNLAHDRLVCFRRLESNRQTLGTKTTRTTARTINIMKLDAYGFTYPTR